MSIYYLFAIIILSPLVISRDNLKAAYIFAIAALVFWLPLGSIPYEYLTVYFLVAATIDLMVIKLLSLFHRPTNFIVRVQKVCLAFIALDFLSWIGFMLDFSPTETYNFLCSVLYALVLLVILTGKSNHVRNYSMDRRYTRLSSYNPTGLYIVPANKCKEET